MHITMYLPDGTSIQVLPHNVEVMISRGWSKTPFKKEKGGKTSTSTSKD